MANLIYGIAMASQNSRIDEKKLVRIQSTGKTRKLLKASTCTFEQLINTNTNLNLIIYVNFLSDILR